MKRISQLIIDTIKSDSAMQSLIGSAVYPYNIDISPDKMPAITLLNVSGGWRTCPKNMKDMTIQLDIWSRNNQTEVENIYERLSTILNYINGTTSSGTIYWWIREENQIDIPEQDDRSLWHKSVRYQVWAK